MPCKNIAMLNVSMCHGLCLHYDCWSWNEKPETREPVLSNTSIIMRAVLGIFYETYSAVIFVITRFFYEISVLIVSVLIVGIIKLKKCIVDPQTILRDIGIIVTDHSATHECLLGRDILYQLPKLREHMEAMKKAVNSWSTHLDDFSEPKAHVDVQRIDMKTLIYSLSTQVEETY